MTMCRQFLSIKSKAVKSFEILYVLFQTIGVKHAGQCAIFGNGDWDEPQT